MDVAHIWSNFWKNLQCRISKVLPGDEVDNDCDGDIDEELRDGKDNDQDGRIDEDISLVTMKFHFS